MPSRRSKQSTRGSDRPLRAQRLSEKQIVLWAKAHFARFRRYPSAEAGPVLDAPGETWARVYSALYRGERGLRSAETLPNLLKRTVGKTRRTQKSGLTVDQIIVWARAHNARTGRWPSVHSGRVIDGPGESWLGINSALKSGFRGLPGGTSLSQLLDKVAGPSRRFRRPRLTVRQIVEWAKKHRERTGSWPNFRSGPIKDASGESWSVVNSALIHGHRGLPGGDTLSQLLHRRVGKPIGQPAIHIPHVQVVEWADAYRRRHGRWPHYRSGSVDGVPGLTWGRINAYLSVPRRGRAGGQTLAKLLQARRGESGKTTHPAFKLSEIVAWAKAFRRRSGRWPQPNDADSVAGWHWSSINRALFVGQVRGVAAGTRLPALLAQRCGAPYKPPSRSPLFIDEILNWADRHHERTGRWPTSRSGPVVGAPNGLTWSTVSTALGRAGRGLPREGRLARLLLKRRGVRHPNFLPKLSVKHVLAWADAYHERNGRWPNQTSGPVLESPENTWSAIKCALADGGRGLAGGTSLWELIRRERGVDRITHKPTLSERRVFTWAIVYHRRTQRWPTPRAGAIKESPQDTWCAVDLALRTGRRGFPKGRSLFRLLHAIRGAPADLVRKRPLKLQEVLLWAKAHARRTGNWPERYDGRVTDAKGETWFGIDEALRLGLRGLPKVKSLGLLFSRLPMPRMVAIGRR